MDNSELVKPSRSRRKTKYKGAGQRETSGLTPKTDKQKEFIDALKEFSQVFVLGPAGTGKTYITATVAADLYTTKKVDKIVITRPMVSVGKVYQNLMVDVKPSNIKLVERAKRIICEATGVDYDIAQDIYQKANNSVKIAIVMILNDCSYDEALAILKKNNNFIKS